MQLTLDVGVTDLAATRFATSPLIETVTAILLLAHPDKSAVNLPWVRWARTQLYEKPLRLPRLWPLIVNGRPSWPEWLAPAPRVRWPGIREELDVIRATPLAQIEVSLGRVFGEGPRPESAAGLLDRPAESLAAIAAELLDCHDRLIGPHWERIRAVCDADIAYRAGGALASGGARSLLNDLHPRLRWSDGRLTLTDARDVRPSREAVLGPDGLVLVPSVFIWPGVSVKPSTTTQTTIRYPARGAAAVWEAGTPSLAATENLLGRSRAWLLTALRSPATPGSLALRLGVTRSAVSQHLKVLYRSGLVERQHSGRQVLYWASDLGLALLSRSRPEERSDE